MSDKGRVRSVKHEVPYMQAGSRPAVMKVKAKLRKQVEMKLGYQTVQLCYQGRERTKLVHRLVAEAFISNPMQKPDVNHINSTPSDNRVENLEWCTPLENSQHCIMYGKGIVTKRGTENHNSVLSESDIPVIRSCLKEGLTLQRIATRYGCHLGTIFNIKRGRTWKHVQ